MTGGLQEQVTDGKENFGIGIEPTSKAIIGTQKVPYIYEDRISKEDFLNALRTMYDMTPEERAKMGKKGSQHVNKNYSFESYKSEWVNLLEKVHQNYGSWDTRKGYERWELREVA
jgi:glycosyltransferase involved in cell wall biosynthesis